MSAVPVIAGLAVLPCCHFSLSRLAHLLPAYVTPHPLMRYTANCCVSHMPADTFYCVVDLHAITAPHDPVELRAATRSVAATYMAAGIDPEKVSVHFLYQRRCSCRQLLL
jgi:hypothetical protein